VTQRLTLLECECYLGHSLTSGAKDTTSAHKTPQSSIQCFYDGARQFSRSHHFCRLRRGPSRSPTETRNGCSCPANKSGEMARRATFGKKAGRTWPAFCLKRVRVKLSTVPALPVLESRSQAGLSAGYSGARAVGMLARIAVSSVGGDEMTDPSE